MLESLAKIFKLLSDPNRLKILYLLEHGSLSVSGIMERSLLSQPLVSFHLKMLREAGFIEPYREGTFVFNKLAHQEIMPLLRSFETYVSEKIEDDTIMENNCCPPWIKH